MKESRRVTDDSVVVSVPSDIKRFAEAVARSKGMTLSDYFSERLIEAIEDEYDRKAAESAYEEYLKNPVMVPWDDVKKETEENENV